MNATKTSAKAAEAPEKAEEPVITPKPRAAQPKVYASVSRDTRKLAKALHESEADARGTDATWDDIVVSDKKAEAYWVNFANQLMRRYTFHNLQ